MAVDYSGANRFAFLDEDATPEPVKKVEKKEKPKKKDEARKDNKPREQKQKQASSGGSSRGGARGGRGGRGGKREFDRQSGTGRRDTQRRDGSGKHNWGAEGDDGSTDRPQRRDNANRNRNRDNKDAAAPAADAAAPAADAAAPAAADAAPAADAEPVPEPEPEVVSYEEYLARKAEATLEEDKNIEARAVQNDDSQWKGAATYVKEDNEDLNSEYGLGIVGKKGEGKKKGKKATAKVNIDEFMKAQGGNRRGGKGGRRGGKGGSNPRDGSRITYDDSNFPKLG